MTFALYDPLPRLELENVLNTLCSETGPVSLTEASRVLKCKPWELRLWLTAHPGVEALMLMTQATMLRDLAREKMTPSLDGDVVSSTSQMLTRQTQADFLFRLADRLEESASLEALQQMVRPTVRLEGANEHDLLRQQQETLEHWGRRVYGIYRDLQERCAMARVETGGEVVVTGVGPKQLERTFEAIEKAAASKIKPSSAAARTIERNIY